MAAQSDKSKLNPPNLGEPDALLVALNAKLAKTLETDRLLETPPSKAAPVKAPNVLDIIEEAIANMPSTEVEWSVIQRYPAGDFKDRVFRAREALVIVRGLLTSDI